MVLVCGFVLPGCYLDVIAGGTAPIGHGHGNAGLDLEVAGGREHSDPHKAYGAGVLTGVRFSEGHTFAPLAAHARGAFSLSPERDERGESLRPLLVGHVALGVGLGLPDDGPEDGPSGLFGQAFVGIGVGSTYKDPNSHAQRGYVAVGAVVSWFSPFEEESAFWMVGAGLEMSTAILPELLQ